MQTKETLFEFKNIRISIEGKEVVKGTSLAISPGERHVIMGPNGSGKSSLVNALMGHPDYEVTEGEIWFKGENISELEPFEKARLGIYLGMQYPVPIPGVTLPNMMRSVLPYLPNKEERLKNLRKDIKQSFSDLSMDEAFAVRGLNEGFSGGEKKKMEILQMNLLKPRMVLLDETDSGLDIDALQIVAEGIEQYCKEDIGLLLVTHYQRLLKYVRSTHVHVFMNGRIVKSGTADLAARLENEGYDWLKKELKEEIK